MALNVIARLAAAAILVPLGLLVAYQWVLALAALWPARRCALPGAHRLHDRTRFVILVPAHNEESGIAATIASLNRITYPRSCVEQVVIADRCSDATAAVARQMGALCLERNGGPQGKGAAIAWALDALTERGITFDALVIVDADSVVDPDLLTAFEDGMQAGGDVQQGYNTLSNPWETPFTRIIAVTSTLRNGAFYAGKARLGLPAMLTGSGMCFSRRIIERYGWTAFSVGEDWEFSASLLLYGEPLVFNARARCAATESRGFAQASPQRLRWASGRHAVAAASAARLVAAGWRQRRFGLCDAALTIVAPTYSAQASLAVVALALSWLVPTVVAGWLFPAACVVAGLLAAYFVLGMALTDAPLRTVTGLLLIPAFLPWRMAIEVMGLLGYGRKRWVRTARVAAR